jgi:hypothetical protein
MGCAVVFVVVVLVGACLASLGGGSGNGGDERAQQPANAPADAEPQEAAQQEEQPAQQPEEQQPQGQQGQQQQRAPKLYQVGETVTVGNVVWTVTDAYRTTLLRSNFGTQKRGNFVVVDFTFTNNRSEEVTLDPELHMVLKDSQGREFGTDPDAWEFVPTRLNIFLEPVNPGLSQNGRVVYEVPPDAGGFVLIVDDVEFWESKKARYDLGDLPTRA